MHSCTHSTHFNVIDHAKSGRNRAELYDQVPKDYHLPQFNALAEEVTGVSTMFMTKLNVSTSIFIQAW